MLKNDLWIIEMAEKGMIEPFHKSQIQKGVISFGVSSYGYDMRIADEFKIFTDVNSTIIDPKKFPKDNFVDFKGNTCIIPPHSFVLGRSVEYFRIPRETLVICFGKSTYARCGILVNITPLEPEWEGYVTVAISNTAPIPARLYAHEGIAQVLFLEGSAICKMSYSEKAGKYQSQKGITIAKM